MGKSYRECPACGKRALSIATRCPACGHELLAEPVRREAPSHTRPSVPLPMLAAILVVGIGLFTLVLRRNVGRDREPRVTASVPAEEPVVLDRAGAGAVTSPLAPAASDSAPGADAIPRLARTWTKVHARRSVKADVVAVLLPGDTVLADSLRGGWWRIALEGRVLGYVYAPTLTP
jgi:hypothetical protein